MSAFPERIDETVVYRIEGLDCPECAASLEHSLRTLDGVVNTRLNYASSSLEVTYSNTQAEQAVIARVAFMGFRLAPLSEPPDEIPSFWTQHGALILTGFATFAWLLGGLLALLRIENANLLYAIAILIGGVPIFRRASTALRTRSLDLYVLMTIAVLGAAMLGAWGEGASVVVLFSIGNALEALTTRRARETIGELMAQAPERATVLRAEKEVIIPVEDVQEGETIVVRPGEKVPLDGRVTSGSSSVNEATITGESIPRMKSPGDAVYAGTLNEHGALEITVIKRYQDSAFASIVQLIQDAQDNKPQVQQRIDRFARYYTPAILIFAVLVAVGGWLLGYGDAVRRALPLLIIGCPCALVLASPIVVMAALSRAARHGILIKEGQYLETGAQIRVIAFDKTGTLTTGHPMVAAVVPAEGESSDHLLTLAASLEHYSEHPLGRAIRRAARAHRLHPLPVTDFRALTGLGVEGRIADDTLWLGSPRLWPKLPAFWATEAAAAEARSGTVLLLGTPDIILGMLVLTDELRSEAERVVTTLQERGYLLRVLSGDTPQATQTIGHTVGIPDVAAGLLPAEKVIVLKQLHERYGPVAMVGDGLNDAPALASTDLGIAMAGAGNATTVASADIVLISDDLRALPEYLQLCRRAASTITQNIVFAVGVKFLLITLALAIILPLWLAVIGDVGTTILVILNSMRLLK